MSVPTVPERDQAPPAVKLVNLSIRDGVDAGASEILFEEGPDHGLVRFRVGGTLSDYMQVPSDAMPYLLRRVAVLSNLYPLKPAETQEGTARVMIREQGHDLAVTFTPSPFGHTLSILVLPRSEVA